MGPGLRDLSRRAAIAVLLAVVAVALEVPVPRSEGTPWATWGLGTVTVLYAAWPLHAATWAAARGRRGGSPAAMLGRLTPHSLASVGLVGAWLWTGLGLLTDTQVPISVASPAVLTAIVLTSRWLTERLRRRATAVLDGLRALAPVEVTVQRINAHSRATVAVQLPTAGLSVGDHFVVPAGEVVATDAVVRDGTSTVDPAGLVVPATGNGLSGPLSVSPGSPVRAGVRNGDGRLVLEATRPGSDNTVTALVALLDRARVPAAGPRWFTRLARAASALALVAAVATALTVGRATESWPTGVATGLAMCLGLSPLSLLLAAPTAAAAGVGRAVELGILVAGRATLERLARVDAVLLGRAGLTASGAARLTSMASAGNLQPAAALAAAAGVESASAHPVGRAIVTAAVDRGVRVPEISDYARLPGRGARASIKGTQVTVGSAALFTKVPQELASLRRPGTTVYVGWSGTARAALTVSDTVGETTAQSVRELREGGIAAYLMTGTAQDAAEGLAEQARIPAERVFGDLEPADRTSVVGRLRADGKVVGVLADPATDRPALSAADAALMSGCAPSDPTVIDHDAAVVLLRDDLDGLVDAVHVSRATMLVEGQSMALALLLALATGALVVLGHLGPVPAAAVGGLASILVTANSLRLGRIRR